MGDRIRLQSLQPSGILALNVTIYADRGGDISASLRHQRVSTSGAYEDSTAGVATPQFSIGAGKYYVIPSAYNPGTTGGFRMLVYSSISSITVNELRKS